MDVTDTQLRLITEQLRNARLDLELGRARQYDRLRALETDAEQRRTARRAAGHRELEFQGYAPITDATGSTVGWVNDEGRIRR